MKPHGLIYLVAIAVVVFIVSGLTVSFFHSVDPGPSGDSSSRPSLRGDGSALEANGDIFLSAAPPLPRTYPDKVSLPVSVSPSAPHDASSSNDEAPASGRGAAGPPDRDRDAERAGGEDEAPIVLLSVGKPASADVRGNLGPPQVVTDERVDDWLSDRWQAAIDMGGRPIPGAHWLEVDLRAEHRLARAVIDWEDGYSDEYVVKGRRTAGSEWEVLGSSRQRAIVAADAQPKREHHVVHEVDLRAGAGGTYRFVRLVILRPATQWGVSVWRLQVWGH